MELLWLLEFSVYKAAPRGREDRAAEDAGWSAMRLLSCKAELGFLPLS